MRTICLSARYILVLAVLLALPTLAMEAGGSGPPQLAAPSITASEISWAVAEDAFAGLELTVSRPDGRVVRYRFPAGKGPYLSLFDATGDPRPDGIYHYELRGTPKRSSRVLWALGGDREPGQAASAVSSAQDAVQAGVFTIRAGAFVIPTEKEIPESPDSHEASAASRLGSTSARDQVTADDLIVQGSECVGTDCVNNESLGTDTLRLKQNNVRIKLEDTSSTSSFPSNDWQLSANDSIDGGANRFSIDDVDGGTTPFTVTAGAPSSSIFVDGNGRVGLGTSTPTQALHARRTSGSTNLELETTDSAAVQLNMVNASGEWQLIAGAGGALNYNRVGVAGNQFIFATNGNMIIQGTLITGGPTCRGGCDRVLGPGSSVESIEDHAASMWSSHYLPAVGPTLAGKPMNLSEKTGGILNELEKAHSYITELNEKLKAKDQQLAELSREVSELKAKEAEVSKLRQRLDRIEAALVGSESQE